MLTHSTNFRVRYGETDQMGYVYYGNYAQYLEVGRVEWLRNIGISYKSMEENGIILPVSNLNITYLKPAKYDDVITLKTTLVKLPTAKIEFSYELFNEQNNKLIEAKTTLVFVDVNKNRPTKAPPILIDKLIPFFT
ncbi:MAG: acyl-CoA thioesterase [Bacteroidetes bacterium]|nr:acyl-CoA thioesterase [Bacteroidota bacterium]